MPSLAQVRKRPAQQKQKKSKRVKLTVKNRAAVDPEVKLGHSVHVLERGDDVFSVTLAKTDVVKNANSFYKVPLCPTSSRALRR